jgi:hypothetical protein
MARIAARARTFDRQAVRIVSSSVIEPDHTGIDGDADDIRGASAQGCRQCRRDSRAADDRVHGRRARKSCCCSTSPDAERIADHLPSVFR